MIFQMNLVLFCKKSKLKNNTKKAIAWRSKFATVMLFAIKALASVAIAAGVSFHPQGNDDNFVRCTNPNDILYQLSIGPRYLRREKGMICYPIRC